MIRSTSFGPLFFMGAAFFFAPHAQAGFEFVPSVEAPAAPEKMQGMPMPVAPAIGTVTAEPLAPQALLDATTAAPKKSGALVINPFPLEESAKHGSGALTVEQAMMEAGGLLRPVVVPGQKSAEGFQARTSLAARRADAPLETAPRIMAQVPSGPMTPLPGGELETPTSEIKITPVPSSIPKPVKHKATVATATPSTSAPASGYTEAVGFGRDLPLALALSQIVPPEFSYAFEKDVNVGSTVSWQGGKAWNVVLDEMLAPNGMRAIIQDNQVTIRKITT